MIDQARPRSAIDAIIGAGRDGMPHESTVDEIAASPTHGQTKWGGFSADSAMLLSRILHVMSTSAKPCIQFVACGKVRSASAVALAATQAAACILGRSLLLDARMDFTGDLVEAPRCEALPDAFVQGLYHNRLAHRTADLDLLFGPNRHGALTKLIAPFHFVAIDSGAPCQSPISTALAAMCSATVLVVRAGESTQGAIKDAASHIIRAGGKVIGSVLEDAPQNLPSWIRRA